MCFLTQLHYMCGNTPSAFFSQEWEQMELPVFAYAQNGAYTIGQDKNSCVVYGMPMEAHKDRCCMPTVPFKYHWTDCAGPCIPSLIYLEMNG